MTLRYVCNEAGFGFSVEIEIEVEIEFRFCCFNLYKTSNVLACGLTRSRFVSNWIEKCRFFIVFDENENKSAFHCMVRLGLGESGARNQMLTFQFVVIKFVINWLKFIIFQVERKSNFQIWWHTQFNSLQNNRKFHRLYYVVSFCVFSDFRISNMGYSVELLVECSTT